MEDKSIKPVFVPVFPFMYKSLKYGDSILDSGGTLEARTQGFDKQLKSISAERETVISRLDKLEASYRSRFSALDATVARLKSDGDYLLAQLQSTSQIISGRRG